MSQVYRVYRKLPGSGWWKAWSQFSEWARIADEMMSAYGQGNYNDACPVEEGVEVLRE